MQQEKVKFAHVELHKKRPLRDFFRTLLYKHILKRYYRKCKTILDIGCGSGLFTKIANEMGFKCDGIDIDPQCNHPQVYKKDFINLKKHYDGFFNSQFIDHVDAVKFMKTAQKYCDNVLVTINNRHTKAFWDYPYHTRPQTRHSLKILYRDFGFRVIRSFWIPFKTNWHYPTSICVIGKKIN